MQCINNLYLLRTVIDFHRVFQGIEATGFKPQQTQQNMGAYYDGLVQERRSSSALV